MEIRPILSTLRRHKTAAALLALEVALTCAIVCNALFLIGQRIEAVGKPSGIDEDRVLEVRVNGENVNPAPFMAEVSIQLGQ